MTFYMVSFETDRGEEYICRLEDKWFIQDNGTIEIDKIHCDYIDEDMYNQKKIHIQNCSRAVVRINEPGTNSFVNYYCLDLKRETLIFTR